MERAELRHWSGRRPTTEKTIAPHLFLDASRSLCPVCRRLVDAQVIARNGKVFLRKYCPDHGWTEALLSSDLSWYLHAQKYNRPGLIPPRRAMPVVDGCPHDCGLCTEHQQHTCLAILEINSACNLRCPVCFMSAGDVPAFSLSLAQVEGMLDCLMEQEGETEVVQVSGGEPTIHPEILEILELIKRRNIRYIMLNTNGLRLARDDVFVRRLGELGVHVYLQYDGAEQATHLAIRGVDLRREKHEALDRMASHGVQAVLAATVAKGVNDHEIGAIVRTGLEHPAVRGVAFQPIFLEGRHFAVTPLDRLTLPDVLRAIETQTQGLYTMRDFTPVPCCHPTCMATAYAYVDGQQVTPLARIVDVDSYIDYYANHALPAIDLDVRRALEGLLSASSVGGSTKQLVNFCTACGMQLPGDVATLLDRVFMINVTGFMDAHTFEVRRVMKCCIHEVLPDGRLVPFCAYNTAGYREQVLHALTHGTPSHGG